MITNKNVRYKTKCYVDLKSTLNYILFLFNQPSIFPYKVIII
nr:MAG TPA: hypothetical protein [Caudoviricetes sp.]